MALYRIGNRGGIVIPLFVVENFNFGGQQSVIVYESPGSDGGTVIVTGRKNRTVTLSGKIIGTDIFDLNNKKVAIEKMRDTGLPINLDSPLDSEDTGRYIIRNFEGSLPPGQERYITFSLELDEYRQANIRRSSVSLVNFQPAELLKQRAIDRNLLAG